MLKYRTGRLFALALTAFCVFAVSAKTVLARPNRNFTDKPPELYVPHDYNDFEEFYYYEPDKLERYEEYQAKNPSLSAEDVVWRVNSMLDTPFYGNVSEIKDFSVFPLLVNKYNRLPEDYLPEDLSELPSGRLVTDGTKEAFTSLVADAASQGYYFRDVSNFRSFSYQSSLYNRYLSGDSQRSVDTYCARPGFSEHQTGRALDLCGPDGVMNRFGSTKEYGWIEKNAWEYGFIVRYPKGLQDITGYIYEPWHITYVGLEASAKMKEEGIKTLEEYTVKFITHSPIQ